VPKFFLRNLASPAKILCSISIGFLKRFDVGCNSLIFAVVVFLSILKKTGRLNLPSFVIHGESRALVFKGNGKIIRLLLKQFSSKIQYFQIKTRTRLKIVIEVIIEYHTRI